MRKLIGLFVAGLLMTATVAVTPAAAQSSKEATIKTRLDHFSGSKYVLVVSYLPSEITSITCEKWTMLGINSYKGQNNFSIPTGPAIAVMDSSGFDGYCKDAGSIIAHTDDGDFVGALDRGPGNWTDSTKVTFSYRVTK
jgi:hypothetical protein